MPRVHFDGRSRVASTLCFYSRPDPSSIRSACAGVDFLCRRSVNGSEAGSFPAPVGTSVHRVLFPPAKVERDPPPPPSSFGWFHSRFGSPQLTIYRTARYSFGRRLAPRAPFWLWFPHPISVVVRVHPWRYAGPTRGSRCPPL